MDKDFKKKLFRGIQYKPERKRFLREKRLGDFGDEQRGLPRGSVFVDLGADDPFGLSCYSGVDRDDPEQMR